MSLKITEYYNDNKIILKIIPEQNEDSLIIIDASEAEQTGEARYQLMEGCSYEYQVISKNNDFTYYLNEIKSLVKPSKIEKSRGRITPGVYVGTINLELMVEINGNQKLINSIPFEVRSIKQDYRDEYKTMLEDITDFCTELIMRCNSPVFQKFSIDYSRDPQIIYQQFAFVKAIVDSDTFDNSIHRIINSPVTKWEVKEENCDIRRIKKISSSVARQIVSKTNRIRIDNIPDLSDKMETLPLRIKVNRKIDTNDTVENQFVKHAISVFYSFCADIKNRMKINSREYGEAEYLENKLGQILNRSFFKEISSPKMIPLHSPVLQRKDGYRELLQIWLKFDLASRLVWQGGDEVYSAGKRDVATLYQYWLFFKLLDLLSEVFSLELQDVEDLIIETNNGLGLKLKAGVHTVIKGIYNSGVRKLRVEFHYNKTFSGNSDYPFGGSWTSDMIPDYTLSIWPAYFNKEEAEQQELIVHIHFDAKYRVKNFKELLGNNSNNDKKGQYKRYDLIKMHAYKDAIRRTGGSYILYPGDKNKTFKGFHEIIPGLGAFAIRPSIKNDGTDELKKFILKVVEHFLNRASKRERFSYHKYEIYKNSDSKEVKEKIPEYHKNKHLYKRTKPPDEESVIIAGCKNNEHYKWIEKNNLYNFRTESARGSLRLKKLTTDASYILIHKKGELVTGDIWQITKKGPRIFSKYKLLQKNYPDPGCDFYLVYEVQKLSGKNFGNIKWDISKLEKYKTGRGSFLPFAVTLSELMTARE